LNRQKLVPAAAQPKAPAVAKSAPEAVEIRVAWWEDRQTRRARLWHTRRHEGIPMKTTEDSFQIEWHNECVVIIPAHDVEKMRWDLIEQAAEIVMAPLKKTKTPMVVFDLSEVNFFGSVFLSLLLRCHKYVKTRGGELVICGPSPLARELLSVTSLDTLWAIYDTRQEALEALSI
jgi:anti-sigma B factor antagonist